MTAKGVYLEAGLCRGIQQYRCIINKLGDYQKALEHLEKALSLKSDFAEVYYNMGLSYKGIGDDKKADEYLEKAYALNPRLKK